MSTVTEVKHGVSKGWRQSPTPSVDILIVGPYPPPLGGVSSHVQRAAGILCQSGYVVNVLNHFSSSVGGLVVGTLRRNPVLYFLKLRKASATIVHYHHAGRLSLLLATALARANRDARWIVTIHNHSLARVFKIPIAAQLAKTAINRFDQVVAVSPEIEDMLEQHIDVPITIMPAYISVAAGKGQSHEWLPAPFFESIGITLVVSAYRVTRWPSSDSDVYGLDVAVKVFTELASEMHDLKLAIFLAHMPRGRWAKRYLRSTMKLVAPASGDRVGLWVGESLSPAFGYRVVYLRPTHTDGDAVSVREALDANVGVIASTVVSRPSGVHAVAIDDMDQIRQVVGLQVERARALDHDGVSSPDRSFDESSELVRAFYRSQLDLAASTAPA
jgi:glycosyltransferase involved in cell wall biosynthesis